MTVSVPPSPCDGSAVSVGGGRVQGQLARVGRALQRQLLERQLIVLKFRDAGAKNAMLGELRRDVVDSCGLPFVILGPSDLCRGRYTDALDWDRLQRASRQAIAVQTASTAPLTFFEGVLMDVTLQPANGAAAIDFFAPKPHVTDQQLPEGSSSNAPEAMVGIGKITLTLRAERGTQTLQLDPQLYGQLLAAHLRPGDVVRWYPSMGAVKRLGRHDAHRPQFDLERDTFLPLPPGSCHKTTTTTTTTGTVAAIGRGDGNALTVDDVDQANFQRHHQLHSGNNGGRQEDFAAKALILRHLVDRQLLQGPYSLTFGLLVIDLADRLPAVLLRALQALREARRLCPCLLLTVHSGWEHSSIDPSLPCSSSPSHSPSLRALMEDAGALILDLDDPKWQE